jgi:mono/diheme cytochrome c family protein
VFTGKGACIACHKAGAIGASPVGPDLSNIAGSQTPEYIMGKILDPASKGTVSGFPPNVMPKTFGQQLTAKEYLDLVSFLLTLKGGAAPAAAGQPAAKAQP